MIRMKCGRCSKVLNFPDENVGTIISCPCGQKLRVPGRQGAASVAATTKSKPAPGNPPGTKTNTPGKGPGKPPVKEAAKPAAAVPNKKPWQDDDFEPYSLLPMTEPPPAIELPKGNEDEEEDGKKGRSKPKPKNVKKQAVSKMRLLVTSLILVVLLGFLALILMNHPTWVALFGGDATKAPPEVPKGESPPEK